jgi:hypothetical protein
MVKFPLGTDFRISFPSLNPNLAHYVENEKLTQDLCLGVISACIIHLCYTVSVCPPMQLFVDKDTVINAVSASHDTHLLKIDNREDELMTRCNSWMSALMKSVGRGMHGNRMTYIVFLCGMS